MEFDSKALLSETKDQMQKSLDHLQEELLKIRAGKASPMMLDGLLVDYYGSPTPLNQVGTVSAPDARTLTIQPYDKNAIAGIEKAIMEANLGLTPQNDGTLIRISIPPLTEERRKQLAKQAKEQAEDAKVSIRNVRRDMNDKVKKAMKDGLAEDEGKGLESEIQKLTDSYSKQIDEMLAAKEADIMKV